MPEPIGSVYLDQPRQVRTSQSSERGARAAIAGWLAFVGIVGLTVAGLLVGVRAAISTPDPIVAAVQDTLDDPAARAEIEAELSDAIRTGLLGPAVIEAAEIYGVDHEAEVDAWAAAVFDDPEFGAAVGDLITEVHIRVFDDPTAGPIDVGPLTDVVTAVAHDTAPTLAPFLPPGGQVIDIDSSELPDLSGPMTALDRALLIALAAGAGLPLALLLHDRRHRVMAWTGRWLLVAGLVLGLATIGLPYVAGEMTGWVTAETAIRSSSIRLLAPAAVAGTVGMGLASMAAVWRRRERRRVAQEGAAAWLSVVEPTPAGNSLAPAFDLPQRGLADAGRQLTNI